MADSNTPPACTPIFPPEVWSGVLHKFGTHPRDLVYLWTGCRGINRHFKREVENIFIENYLPLTFLRFSISTSDISDPIPTAEYSRVSTDRAVAFFQGQCDHYKKEFQQVHNGDSLSAPSYLIGLWGSKATLPVVTFHANGDIGVGWRELFSALLAEEKHYYETDFDAICLYVSQLRSPNSHR